MELPDNMVMPLMWGLLYSLGCFVITWVVRKIVEGIAPRAKANRYWVDIALPTMPVVLGGLVAVALKEYPYPMDEPKWPVRLLLGVVAGFCSAWAVKIAKVLIKAKTGADLDQEA